MTEQTMIKSFRDKNLELFYMESKRDRAIPATSVNYGLKMSHRYALKVHHFNTVVSR